MNQGKLSTFHSQKLSPGCGPNDLTPEQEVMPLTSALGKGLFPV